MMTYYSTHIPDLKTKGKFACGATEVHEMLVGNMDHSDTHNKWKERYEVTHASTLFFLFAEQKKKFKICGSITVI